MTQWTSRTAIEQDLRMIKPLSDFIFADETHSKVILQGLNSLRKTRTLCDVTLKVNHEDRGIPVHRQVLAAFCPYFETLYTSEKSNALSKDIILQDVNCDALEVVLEYIYTGSLTLTPENARDIFCVSASLHLETLQVVCSKYLVKCITVENCLQLLFLGRKHQCRELLEMAQVYIGMNFVEIVENIQFPDIDANDLKVIISGDYLKIENEYEVYQAVKKWIEHDFEQRLKYIPLLMSQVRFRFVPREFLTADFKKDSIMISSPLSRDFVHEALMYETLTPEEQSNVHTLRVKPRWCTQSMDVILLVGGVSAEHDPLGSCHWAFDPLSSQWYTASSLLSTRYYFGLTRCDNKLYVFGGSTSGGANRSLATIEVYYPELNQWKTFSKTIRGARSHFDAVTVGDVVYLVGGMCSKPHENSLETFFPPLAEANPHEPGLDYHHLTAPKQPRYDHCTVVLKGKIYCIGGCSRGHSALNTVECYDPDQNIWTDVAHLLVPRSGACAVVLDNYIVVIGGSSNKKPLNSCEAYNPNEDKWEHIAPMNERRDRCSGVYYKEKIYVFGGSYGRVVHNSVECYTAKTNRWKVVSHLPASKYGFKCTTSFVNRALVQEICFEQV